MPVITAATFKADIDDSDLDDEVAESIIDKATDALMLYASDVTLGDMHGTAGEKTLTVSKKQRAAIYLTARAIYASYYKNAMAEQSVGIGALSVSQADMMSNPVVLGAIKEAAQLLRERDWSRSII